MELLTDCDCRSVMRVIVVTLTFFQVALATPLCVNGNSGSNHRRCTIPTMSQTKNSVQNQQKELYERMSAFARLSQSQLNDDNRLDDTEEFGNSLNYLL